SWHDGAAEDLPFESGAFDGAVFFATIEFVADAAKAVDEAIRVLRPGGWLAVGYLNTFSPWTALYRHEADHGSPPWAAARFFSRDDLEQLAGQAAVRAEAAVWLAPLAEPPYGEADAAGRRAGNAPAFELLLWRKP